MAHDPLEHVLDQDKEWTIFTDLFGGFDIPLPYVEHVFGTPYTFRVTKFMILEVIAAVLVAAVYIPLCRRAAAQGGAPRGAWWNAFESLLTFIRNEVVRPNLGEDADRYMPFLWTMFVFILFCNLLGMVPLMGSPTASLYMTIGLAACSFIVLHGVAIAKMGPLHYLISLWPHVEIMPFPGRAPAVHGGHGHDGGHGHGAHAAAEPPPRQAAWWEWPLWGLATLFGIAISFMIFAIELLSSVIKSTVLGIRLFANMFAGHTVLAMILLLIVVAGEAGFSLTWTGVTVASVLGVVALSLLELFIAFLQAYVFVFLTALFMGMALHPSH
jgi:F-type H+-transporting ATPase subunit a